MIYRYFSCILWKKMLSVANENIINHIEATRSTEMCSKTSKTTSDSTVISEGPDIWSRMQKSGHGTRNMCFSSGVYAEVSLCVCVNERTPVDTDNVSQQHNCHARNSRACRTCFMLHIFLPFGTSLSPRDAGKQAGWNQFNGSLWARVKFRPSSLNTSSIRNMSEWCHSTGRVLHGHNKKNAFKSHSDIWCPQRCLMPYPSLSKTHVLNKKGTQRTA